MLNKSKFKKFVKDGVKNVLMFDTSKGWIIDGYAMYSLKDGMTHEVLYDVLQIEDVASFRNGVQTSDDIIKFEKIIEYDHMDAPEITITPFVGDSGKHSVRIFVDKNGENRLCQQKYLDVLGDFYNYKFTQFKTVSPIYVWEKESLIALILPIRPDEDRKYEITILN